MAYPYTPAFVAYCGGAPIEEISEEFKIPFESLKSKIRQEGWRALANRLTCYAPADSCPNEEALSRVETNRVNNYEQAAKLRADVAEIVDHLRRGSLKVKKQFQSKGQIVEYETTPTISDRLNIANYATAVANLTYRALGDHIANGGYKADASPGAPPPTPPITIILPPVIAEPRNAENHRSQETVGT